jgi:hypothetical protein
MPLDATMQTRQNNSGDDFVGSMRRKRSMFDDDTREVRWIRYMLVEEAQRKSAESNMFSIEEDAEPFRRYTDR